MVLYIIQLADVPSPTPPRVLFPHTDTFTCTRVGTFASEVVFVPSGIQNRAFKSILQYILF